MSKERRIVILIFIFAMLLRMVPGYLNRQANDNHVDVVNWIVDKHELPQKNDCWSCYQPKLYYIVCAGLVKLFDVKGSDQRMLVMQVVNIIISFFILLFFLKFITKQNLDERNKLLTFSFFAFNPCLIGINVQGTNDTPVILCGVLAVYAADSFFRQMKFSGAILLTLALIAGALTKASALILAGVVFIVFMLKILAENSPAIKWKTAKYMLILIIPFVVVIPFAGGYYNNYKQYGSLTLSTWNKDPKPCFFKTTPVVRPGLQNMFEGYLTFRYFDMIRQPYINNEPDNYPLHRTSLWSQLYGRTVFMHFDQWPPAWQSHHPIIVIIGRILIIFGIVPLTLFLIGIINSLDFLRNLWKRNRNYLASPQNYLHLLVVIALLCSSVFYTYNYRDFSSMKSFYIFPGLLSFIKFFGDGLASLKSRVTLLITKSVLLLIIVLSIADVIFLICQLHPPS